MHTPYAHPSNWPGFRTLFTHRIILFATGARGISPGIVWPIRAKHAEFARHGWDVISGVRCRGTVE